MKIGYSDNNYPTKRNIINIVTGHVYKKVYNISKVLSIASMINNKFTKLPILKPSDRRFSFNDFNLNSVDIFHFFNTVSFGKTPWSTTFETVVPRFNTTLSCHWGNNCSYSPIVHGKKILRAIDVLCSIC